MHLSRVTIAKWLPTKGDEMKDKTIYRAMNNAKKGRDVVIRIADRKYSKNWVVVAGGDLRFNQKAVLTPSGRARRLT